MQKYDKIRKSFYNPQMEKQSIWTAIITDTKSIR